MEAKAGTQGTKLEAGTETVIPDECCLLAYSPHLIHYTAQAHLPRAGRPIVHWTLLH